MILEVFQINKLLCLIHLCYLKNNMAVNVYIYHHFRIALRMGLDRGWFSYTELLILSHDLKLMNWSQLASELSKVKYSVIRDLSYFLIQYNKRFIVLFDAI